MENYTLKLNKGFIPPKNLDKTEISKLEKEIRETEGIQRFTHHNLGNFTYIRIKGESLEMENILKILTKNYTVHYIDYRLK